MGEFAVGQSVPREEDPRLLTGGGEYLDDVNLRDQACLLYTSDAADE